MREGVRKKNRLVGNFHLVKDTLTNWRILFVLCKLLFLQHCYNVSKQNFFNLVETKINKSKKFNNALQKYFMSFLFMTQAQDLIKSSLVVIS